MSSKRFAGEVIWGSCALGFNETCFGFCVFADLDLVDHLDLSMAATRQGNRRDREITFDLSTAATGGDLEQRDHFGSESLVDSSLQMVDRKLSWRKRDRHGRFPAQAPVLIDEDDAEGDAPPFPSSRMMDDNVRK